MAEATAATKRPAHEVLIEKLNGLIEEKEKLQSEADSNDITTDEGFKAAMEKKGREIANQANIGLVLEVLTGMYIPDEAKSSVQEVLKRVIYDR